MYTIVLLCAAGFLSAFVDSIAGGGGLISVPAFMLSGLPPAYVLGTNKFCSSFGSGASSFKFIKSDRVNFNLLKYLLPFTFIGAALGVKTVLAINEDVLNALVIIMVLFIGVYSLFSKTLGLENKFKGISKKNIFSGILLAFSLGFYDGFFGPGAGSFLIFGLIKIFGFDFVNSVGNARLMNFTSNITSLILFAISQKIYFTYALPVAVFMIIGARIGTKVALNKGAKVIKPIFITMSLAVAVKLLYNMIK